MKGTRLLVRYEIAQREHPVRTSFLTALPVGVACFIAALANSYNLVSSAAMSVGLLGFFWLLGAIVAYDAR